jgi:hypothetical protein
VFVGLKSIFNSQGTLSKVYLYLNIGIFNDSFQCPPTDILHF